MVRAGAAIAFAAALTACGGSSSPPAAREAPAGVRMEHEVDPTDLFPADLDLVIRVDVGRMRAGIGPAAADALAQRALKDFVKSGDTPDPPGGEEIRAAIACAEVVWIATRFSDLDTGDRVIAVEGKRCMPDLAAARWERVRSGNGKLRIFDRTSEAPRGGAARIMNLGNKATVFVSPVELDAVKRVMDAGPDPKRGAPTAEGLVSVDLRAGRLSPALEKKYPSIGAVLAGIERVRGSAVLVDEGLSIDAQVLGTSPEGATRAARFLSAMRDSLAKSARFGPSMKDARVELVEKMVHVRLTIPTKALLSSLEAPPATPPAP